MGLHASSSSIAFGGIFAEALLMLEQFLGVGSGAGGVASGVVGGCVGVGAGWVGAIGALILRGQCFDGWFVGGRGQFLGEFIFKVSVRADQFDRVDGNSVGRRVVRVVRRLIAVARFDLLLSVDQLDGHKLLESFQVLAEHFHVVVTGALCSMGDSKYISIRFV